MTDSPVNFDLPSVLLPYQQRLLQTTAAHAVVIYEKSRRIGITWAVGADAVLTAAAEKSAGGMDVHYIGFNLDMTKEFIDTCGEWAKSLSYACTEVEEFMFKDIDVDGNTKEIQAFRIKFDSGFQINALTSRPRSLRGRQGYVIIDEAAFHDDLAELMKAALALLIWGGKVLVISTHNGVDNPFNRYIQDAHAGRNKYKVLRTTFDDALEDGLYKRICLSLGRAYSVEGEQEWRDEITGFYGDGADEELFCIPRLSAGKYLNTALVESRMSADIPVIRYKQTDGFVHLPEFDRQRIIEDWCNDTLRPYLDTLDETLPMYMGGDIARSGDLTVFIPLILEQGLTRRPPFVVELKNVPFSSQRQILWFILDRLRRFIGAAIDARGNGQQMAEETMQRYGAGRVHCVMTSAKWYLEALPKYKAALEDATLMLPKDADILADHMVVEVVGGLPNIPNKRTTGADGNKRHGDSFVAAAMAYWASLQSFIEYNYDTPTRSSGTDDDLDAEYVSGRFNGQRGAF